MKKYLLVFLIFFSLINYGQNNFYVSSIVGNDSFSGKSENKPFKTLQKAADMVQAGDHVYVMNGNYSNMDNPEGFYKENIMYISATGRADAWITFEPLTGHQPKLFFNQAFGIRIHSGHLSKGQPAAYIRIKGFEIEGDQKSIPFCEALMQSGSCQFPDKEKEWRYGGTAISIGSNDGFDTNGNPTHHIEILDCKIYNCPGSGVSAYHSDYVSINHCEIFNCCWKSTNGNSAIHIYNPRTSLIKTDEKYRYSINNNRIYNNRQEVPWFGFGKCHGFTDGNGIIIDDAQNLQSSKINYSGNFLIKNNILYENGGSGISIYQSDHVDIIGNITYLNCQVTPDNNGRAEIKISNSNNIFVEKNIIYAHKKQVGLNRNKKTKVKYGVNLVYQGKKNVKSKLILKANPLFKDVNPSKKEIIICRKSQPTMKLEVIPESSPKDFTLLDHSPAKKIWTNN